MKYKLNGEASGALIEYWKIIELCDTSLILKDTTAETNDLSPEIRHYHH